MKDRWKNYELIFLKDNYRKLSVDQLVLKLGRSRNSITKKMSREGFNQKLWSEEEDNYLKVNFEKYTNYELSRLLNRSIDGIAHRLMKLKLKKNKEALSYLWRKSQREFKKGEESHRWKGGVKKDKFGYIWVYAPDHPQARKKYIREHRLVMEHKIGRFLRPEEVVHHINEIKDDNRPENLMLLPNEEEHGRIHYEMKKGLNQIDILGRFKKIEEASIW